MTDEQMLLAMSNMMDAKLKPVNNEIQALKTGLCAEIQAVKADLQDSISSSLGNITFSWNIFTACKSGRNRILLYWHI